MRHFPQGSPYSDFSEIGGLVPRSWARTLRAGRAGPAGHARKPPRRGLTLTWQIAESVRGPENPDLRNGDRLAADRPCAVSLGGLNARRQHLGGCANLAATIARPGWRCNARAQALGNVQGESLKATSRVSQARFQTPARWPCRRIGPEKPKPESITP